MTGGAFAVPVGSMGTGTIEAGGAYKFTVISGSTGKLSFATMFVQSNDLFYGSEGMGISLFDGSGMPICSTGNLYRSTACRKYRIGKFAYRSPVVDQSQVKSSRDCRLIFF